MSIKDNNNKDLIVKRLFENCHCTFLILALLSCLMQRWLLASCWKLTLMLDCLEGEKNKATPQGRSRYPANPGKPSVRDQPPLWYQQRGDYQMGDISLSLKNRADKWTQRETLLFFSLSLSSLRANGMEIQTTGGSWWRSGDIGAKKHQHTMATTLPESTARWWGWLPQRNPIISCMPLLSGALLQFPQSKVYRLGPCWLLSIISLQQLNWAGCGGGAHGGLNV